MNASIKPALVAATEAEFVEEFPVTYDVETMLQQRMAELMEQEAALLQAGRDLRAAKQAIQSGIESIQQNKNEKPKDSGK